MSVDTGTSVLLVEDDQPTLHNLRGILEGDGYHVDQVASFQEAIGSKRLSDFVIVILDRQLPDGQANDFLPRFKELAPSASFIIVTGYADLDSTTSVLRDGAEDFILKPINADLLRARLAHVVRMHEAERRARCNDRLATIGQMVAGIAHESRNSLQRILSAVEMLRLDLEDSPDQQKELTRIEQATDDIRHLLDEIRSFAGPLSLDRDCHDLSTVWRNAWTQVQLHGPQRAARLCENTDGCDLTCSIDGFRLTQVFRNLFENSCAACSSVPRVEVSCAEFTQHGQPLLRIVVRDNGTGFEKHQRDKAFEPFFTTKSKGTGLGMAIAKRIVEAHGGNITIGPNRSPGAEVVINLPRVHYS